MEGIAFILIGAAIFSQAWYVLGLYPDGRTMGMYAAGFGLVALIALVMDPMLLGMGGDPDIELLPDSTIMKMLIILWAGYGVGVGAQGLLDLDERAVGFFSAFVAAGSAVAFFYFATTAPDAYGDEVAIALATPPLLLSIMAGMVFFYMAIPFNVLRLVAGWFLLLGSMAVAGIGLAIISTLIEV